jgi:hypothetical protein
VDVVPNAQGEFVQVWSGPPGDPDRIVVLSYQRTPDGPVAINSLEEEEAAQRPLLELLHRLDFARRWYDLCASTLPSRGADPLPAAEVAAALAATGRIFRYDRRERFYATRERVAAGELGLNLWPPTSAIQFILVVKTPVRHIGDTFAMLMRSVQKHLGPALPAEPNYPDPHYRDGTELRRILAEGLRLYDNVAGAVLASGLLTGALDTGPDPAQDRQRIS